MSEDMKPCPFCGAPARIGTWTRTNTGVDGYRAECTDCFVSQMRSHTTPAEATAQWNRRVSPAVERAGAPEPTYPCPECGHATEDHSLIRCCHSTDGLGRDLCDCERPRDELWVHHLAASRREHAQLRAENEALRAASVSRPPAGEPDAWGVENSDGSMRDVEFEREDADSLANSLALLSPERAPYTVVPLYRHPAARATAGGAGHE